MYYFKGNTIVLMVLKAYFDVSGGICGREQRAASPSSVPQRPGQRSDPRHPQQGPHEGRRAHRYGAHLLHPGEHHLKVHALLTSLSPL